MSCIETLKISNKNSKKQTIDYKNRQKGLKGKIIFNTMIDLDKFKTKKISKSKSTSIIIGKRKNSEKKTRQILIPMNLCAPSIKTYNTKKKIEYNKSASDIINNNPLKGLSNKNHNINCDYEYFYKNKKNSQHNTVNYIINNFNLSLKKKESNLFPNKLKEFKGINKSLISSNNNKYEELKKENEELNKLYKEKMNENKKHKNKMNYLENKNAHTLNKIEKIKKENEKYSQILEKVLKLLQILKKKGLNIEEILENLSETEDDLNNSNNSYENKLSENSSFNSKSSENNFEINSNLSHFKSEGEFSDQLKTQKIYKESKVNLKDNSIPKLDMDKIYNIDTIHDKKIDKNNKHKNYSHSVGK